MKQTKNNLSIIFIVVALWSCNKSATPLPVDKRQYFTNSYLTHFVNVKLYSRDGEISSNVLSQKYADEFGGYFFDKSSSYTDPDFQKFVMLTEDSIINISKRIPVIANRKIIDTYDKFSSNSAVIINDTSDISWYISKYKVLQRFTSSGYNYYESESPVYFLKKIRDTLFFPIVRYVVISRRPYVTYFSADKFNNVFLPDGVSKLGQYDTLVMQSFDLAMKKTL